MAAIIPADGAHVAEVADEKGELDALNRFLQRIGEQDERAMVLALAAFIEDALGGLLIAYFRDCKATRDLIDGFNAPLGTLSSRIKAVFAFGLATEQQFKDMEILRKIRNNFAHDWEGISLQRNDIAAIIGQLSGYTFSGVAAPTEGKAKLLSSLSNCCVELYLFKERIKAGKASRAPDVSHRLTTTPPIQTSRARYVD